VLRQVMLANFNDDSSALTSLFEVNLRLRYINGDRQLDNLFVHKQEKNALMKNASVSRETLVRLGRSVSLPLELNNV